MSARQIPLQFQPRRQDRLEDFVLGSNQGLLGSNRNLLELLKQLPAQNSDQSSAQPDQSIFLSGESGVGKTHLLSGLCHAFQCSGRTAIYLPLKRLETDSAVLLEGLESTELIAVDDIDAISGQLQWEQAIFHLINRVLASSGKLVFAARSAPGNISLALPDLKSRLSWGQVHRVQTLDEPGRRQVVQNFAQRQGFAIPQPVMNYFFSRSQRNLKELLAAVDTLSQAAFIEKRAITLPLAREVLMRHQATEAKMGI